MKAQIRMEENRKTLNTDQPWESSDSPGYNNKTIYPTCTECQIKKQIFFQAPAQNFIFQTVGGCRGIFFTTWF
jgi:hypothetical protein